MRLVALSALALALAACTAAIATRPEASGSPAPPTPTLPVVDVSGMMGVYPRQTVFVVTADHVSAVTLLNHFVRYQIPTHGVAEVSVDASARWLRVLDGDDQGARRLRVFDVPTGAERLSLSGITSVPPGNHALGVASDGRVLVLKSNGRDGWVDSYHADTLQPTGVVLHGQGCSDRLLAAGIRVAIICSSTGQVALGTRDGATASIDAPLPEVIGAAMASDGTLFLVTADEHLVTVAPDSTTPVATTWPRAWSGRVVADGLAIVQAGSQLAIAETASDGAWLRMMAVPAGTQQRSFYLAGAPNGGVVAMWPFAYYAVGSTIRHVDLTSGLLETMAEIGPAAAAAAVVND